MSEHKGKAKSKAQRRLFGMALAVKRGEFKGTPPQHIKKMADSMTEEKLIEYAGTKQKRRRKDGSIGKRDNIPYKVEDKSKSKRKVNQDLNESTSNPTYILKHQSNYRFYKDVKHNIARLIVDEYDMNILDFMKLSNEIKQMLFGSLMSIKTDMFVVGEYGLAPIQVLIDKLSKWYWNCIFEQKQIEIAKKFIQLDSYLIMSGLNFHYPKIDKVFHDWTFFKENYKIDGVQQFDTDWISKNTFRLDSNVITDSYNSVLPERDSVHNIFVICHFEDYQNIMWDLMLLYPDVRLYNVVIIE